MGCLRVTLDWAVKYSLEISIYFSSLMVTYWDPRNQKNVPFNSVAKCYQCRLFVLHLSMCELAQTLFPKGETSFVHGDPHYTLNHAIGIRLAATY